MRNLLIRTAILLAIAPAAMAQTGNGADAPIKEAPGKFLVFFPWNKAALTDADKAIVAQAAQEFRSSGSARIDVTGFTDTSGSPAYNLRLSERRARMVADELERLGIPPADLVVVGRGQEDLRVPTADNVREAGIRRVEIVFDVAAAAPAPAAPVAAATEEPPHPKEAIPRLGLDVGLLYGHNFGEKDASNDSNERENDLAGVEFVFDALPGNLFDVRVKQAVLYSFNGEDDGINGRTGLGFGLKPFNLGLFKPYLSANLGYIYGPGVQDGPVAGPELGFDVDFGRATFLNAKVAWDHQFRNQDFDRGILWAGVGLGYRF